MTLTTRTRFVLLVCLTLSINAYSQTQSASYQPFKKGLAMVESAYQTAGGRDIIGKVKNLTLHYQDLTSSRGQNISPNDADVMQKGGDAKLVFDVENVQSYHKAYLQRRGRLFDPIIVLKEKKSFFYWPETKELDTAINTDLIKTSFGFRFAYPQRLLPMFLLQNALQNKSTIRLQGESEYLGSKQNIVTFVHTDGALITMFIDAKTSLVTKTEELFNDFDKGDVVGSTVYKGYTAKNGVQIPGEIAFDLSGEVIRRMLIGAVAVNSQIDPSMFAPPEGISEADYPPVFKPQPLGNGVFFMPLFSGTGITYNSMFVVFDDYVMVFDAPLSDLLSNIYVQIISSIAPGKPIKYIVPTHHHSDHIGGIRRFIAQGSIVVSTKENETLFRELVKVRSDLSPIPLSIGPENLSFDIVDRKKIFRSKSQTVEVYDVGPNSHAKEILIAYVPKAKILYVTDLLWIPLVEGHYPPARETLTNFGKAIEKLGLDVEVIVPGHGKVGSVKNLRDALKSL